MTHFFKARPKTSIVVAIVMALIITAPLASYRPVAAPEEVEYGVTFSYRVLEDMGLDWRQAYTQMLDDLGVRRLRVPVYWDLVEPKEEIIYYETVDWQVAEAAKRGAEVILAIGGRVPRWPECHLPEWVRAAGKTEREESLLRHVERTVKRYQAEEAVSMWQVENEPFLPVFGECPAADADFLDREIELVRALDPSRPIMLTDSGELSLWYESAKRSDVFGTSLYLKTYSQELSRYIDYPIWPWFFRLKRNIVEAVIHPDPRMIVSELQAEPWGPQAYHKLTKQERERTMNLDQFRYIVSFARQTGFAEMYLWGVEYWFWEKEVNNEPGYWEYAKTLFN